MYQGEFVVTTCCTSPWGKYAANANRMRNSKMEDRRTNETKSIVLGFAERTQGYRGTRNIVAGTPYSWFLLVEEYSERAMTL